MSPGTRAGQAVELKGMRQRAVGQCRGVRLAPAPVALRPRPAPGTPLIMTGPGRLPARSAGP
jgi:hypothetical protein